MTTTAVSVRWCSTCRGDVTFERPECLEAPGADCPEWVCVQCGEAVFGGFWLTEPVVVTGHPTAHVA